MARVIAVCNHKGGVGKTTITANLGFALARHFKVLLIDLDPQANLTTGLGFDNCKETIGKCFREVIHFRHPEPVPSVINEYVHIIPGKVDLLDVENRLHDTVRGEYVMKEIVSSLKSKYDLIIIDCPPSYNWLTINALNCCNLILIPAKPEVFSILGIRLIKHFADENAVPFKIIFNQVDGRSTLHKKVIEKTAEQFKYNLLENNIRNTIGLAEAFEHAQNIFHYKSDSIGASDFSNIADELIQYI